MIKSHYFSAHRFPEVTQSIHFRCGIQMGNDFRTLRCSHKVCLLCKQHLCRVNVRSLGLETSFHRLFLPFPTDPSGRSCYQRHGWRFLETRSMGQIQRKNFGFKPFMVPFQNRNEFLIIFDRTTYLKTQLKKLISFIEQSVTDVPNFHDLNPFFLTNFWPENVHCFLNRGWPRFNRTINRPFPIAFPWK